MPKESLRFCAFWALRSTLEWAEAFDPDFWPKFVPVVELPGVGVCLRYFIELAVSELAIFFGSDVAAVFVESATGCIWL